MAYGPPPTFDPTNVMGRRIAAWVIDALIPAVIALAVGWTIFVGSATKFTSQPQGSCTEFHLQQPGTACVQLGNDVYVGTSDDAHRAFAIGGLIYLVGAVNLFIVQGLTGAAIGKHMLGLRVVRADGSLVGFGWNALRTLMLVVDQFFCALPGIITAGVTHPHRRVGDFAAGTFVVAKQSVGMPIGGVPGGSGYPPPWTPPGGPVGWGPPPGGTQPAGAPQWGAPAPGWGNPQAPGPAPTPAGPTAAPTWGTPAPGPQATPPPAQTPTSWGAPVPDDLQQPPPAQQPVQAASGRAPQWDAQRNAWVFWEVETNRWLQHDPATGEWGPLR